MTTKNVFLDGEFVTGSDLPQTIPGFTFTVPANSPAKLKLQFLYSAPPDVDALLSIDVTPSQLTYAGFVFDGSHQVDSPPDADPSAPASTLNFTPILPKGLAEIELPGRGILFRRNGLFVEYFFIGGNEDVTFDVQLRQRSPGTLDSYLHWGFAEFKTV